MTLSGSHTVLANGTAGYSIGEVTVLDPDVEQTHIISIKGPNSDFIKAIYLPIPVNIFKLYSNMYMMDFKFYLQTLLLGPLCLTST